VTDPLVRVTSRGFDAAGRLTSETNPLGQTTQYNYDPLNQITKVTDALGNATSFSHDGNGNLTSVTDANGHVVSYTYDGMDRLASRTDPLSRSESYSYDGDGNVTQFTDRRGKVTAYAYDGLNRRTFAGFGKSGTSYESTITYSFDLGNRPTQAVDSVTGAITSGYDGLDRLTSEATPEGTVSYAYDAAGRRTSMTAGSQTAVSYSHDNANRLTQITQGTATVAFSYDSSNRRTSLTLPNSEIMNYSYNSSSQLIGINYVLAGSTLGNLAYSYDLAGRRIVIGGSYATTGLPVAVSLTSYDAANELTEWGTATPTYDSNGNTLSDGTNVYVWNGRNQLASMNSGADSFQYDPFGRRVAKTNVTSTTNYLYDGLNPVQELSGTTPTANLLTGGLDEYFQRTDSTGTANFLSDALGSTLSVTDNSGNTLAQYKYEPFGNTTISGSSTNPYQYIGRENDGTGVFSLRARYYNPASGRFLSEDPKGFAAAASDLYEYAYDSPTNFTDPTGNCPWCVVAGVGAGYGALTEGFKGYKCGDQGWKLAGDVGRGAVAGGVGALVGLYTGFTSGSPFLGGAAGSAAYDATNLLLQPGSWGNFGYQQGLNTLGDIELGAATGGAAEVFGPSVQGGWNFNPFTSPRTLGPKAMQEYARDGISGAMGTGASMFNSLAGRKDRDCQ
jgi:RHS repeat-associated protein